jgi:hypothetical protein
MEFEKKVGKTFLYYGFTVEKKFFNDFVEMYGLSLENLNSDAILHLEGEQYPVQTRLVNQDRSKTTKLKPSDLPSRLVIQIVFKKALLQKFNMLYCKSKEYYDRNQKPPFTQKAYFKIESNGQIYCTVDDTIVQKSPLIPSSSIESEIVNSDEISIAILERLWASRSTDDLINDFLVGVIALAEEEKKPENIPPQYRDSEDFEGGIHFWQLQQSIEELAQLLADREGLDEVEERWKGHELFWGRYLSTGAIEYARRLKADPEYQDEEFAMDWVVPSEENPGSE